MPVTLSNKIIRNVFSSGVRALFLIPVPLVMTPLILHEIGSAGYGTWAVLVALNNLTSLADLGMVGTVSKYVAEYHTHEDHQSLNRLLNTGLVIFSVISSVVALAIWFAAPLIVHGLFRGSPLATPELVFLLRVFLIVLGANILTLLFSSITSGLQRLDISNWIGALNTLGAAFIGAILLLRGWGLRGLVFGQVCAAIVSIAVYGVMVKKLLPRTYFSAGHIDAAEAKKMFSFSLRLYITQAAVAVHNQLEKFLLALFVGVSAAGWYDIGCTIALKLRSIVALVLDPVLPAASELDARGDQQRLADLYYRAQKYLAFIGLPLGFYATIVSRRFVDLWVGPKLSFVAIPLVILMWVNFYNLLTGPGFLIFAGRGFLRPGIQSALLGFGSNVILSVALIYRFGFAGAVVGTSLSLILASTFFMYLFHKSTNYPVTRLFRDAYLKPFTTAALIAVPAWLFVRTISLSWAALFALAAIFGLLYVTAILLNRFIDQYEWRKIESFIPAVRHFRGIIPIA